VGGHCLTKDTYHLERGVKVAGNGLDYPVKKDSLFVLARNINDFMPRHMYNMTVWALDRLNKTLPESKITVLGWAFINDSDDARNTPSEVYRDLLRDAGAQVKVHDPYVMSYPGVQISHDIKEALADTDVVAIFAGHKEYKALQAKAVRQMTGRECPVVVDGRNVIEPDAFIAEGFVYKGIGRGDKNEHKIVCIA
jgi:UDP-N-acetyl-D-mannosaminuronic acid dehydrogenase